MQVIINSSHLFVLLVLFNEINLPNNFQRRVEGDKVKNRVLRLFCFSSQMNIIERVINTEFPNLMFNIYW